MNSLFTIDISALFSSSVGSSGEFEFDQEIDTDTFEEIICTAPLKMNLKLIRKDFGIECLFLRIETTLDFPEEAIKNKKILLENIIREFHLKKKPGDIDDVEYIDNHKGTIDLGRVIAQELVIAAL